MIEPKRLNLGLKNAIMQPLIDLLKVSLSF